MIHICLKTCNVCSTKYICKTQQDPYKYEGSGTEWKEHNKRCGINHTTEILFSSDSIKEVELFCEEYERQNPEYWKTLDYANMIKEGGGYNNAGDANPNHVHKYSFKFKSYEDKKCYCCRVAFEKREIGAHFLPMSCQTGNLACAMLYV